MLKPFPVLVSALLSQVVLVATAHANQFLVYIPNLNPNQTAQAKTIAPDGFFSNLDNGQRVFQVGRFNSLPLAQKRVQDMRQAGFAAEIKSVAPKVAVNPIPAPIPVESYPPAPPVVSNPAPQPLPGVPSAVDNSSPAPQPIEISRSSTYPQPISSLPPAPPVAPVAVAPPVDAPPVEENRYFVIIPTTSHQILQRVKTVSPQAKFKSSNRGAYIEVQGYPDRASAETMSATMRGQGFDARVAYF